MPCEQASAVCDGPFWALDSYGRSTRRRCFLHGRYVHSESASGAKECTQGPECFRGLLPRDEVPRVDGFARWRGHEVAPCFERPKVATNDAARPPENQGRTTDPVSGAHIGAVVRQVDGGTGAIVLADRMYAFA